jgi:hypothetical protein
VDRGGAVRAGDHRVRTRLCGQPQAQIVVDGFGVATRQQVGEQIEQQIAGGGGDGRAMQCFGERELGGGGLPLFGLASRIGDEP